MSVIVRKGSSTLHAMAKSWAQSGKWTPEWLSQHMSGVLTVKRSKRRFFMYAEDPHPRYLNDSDAKAYEFLAMEPADFFEQLSQDKDNFYYHTSELSQQAPNLLLNAPGWEDLVPRDKPHGELSVWIGGARTATQAHYDVYDNTFVQMHGRKTFTCYPPSQYHNLHVYPDAHPRARKSQVNFDAPDLTRFPFYQPQNNAKITFELLPGDVLQIPAFWFHHVEANDISVSLNIFSESSSRPIADRIFARSPPFNPDWPGMVMLLCYRMLVQEVLQRLDLPAHQFLANIVRSRYQPLIGDEMAVEEFSLLSTPWPWDKVNQVLSEVQAKSLFIPFAEDLVKDFKLLRGQDEGICQIVLAHVFEMWGLQCVDSEDLPRFFRYALHSSLLR